MAGRPVAIVGGGTWGLSLAAAAARTGGALLHSRKPRGDGLPPGVKQAADFAQVGREARLIVLAVPSHAAKTVLKTLGDHLDGRHLVVHGIRGLAGEEMRGIAELVCHETPVRRVGALGGPALAEDLLAGRPSVMVCGSHYAEVTEAVKEALTTDTLRLYTTDDLVGLEWASALVGCLAIGVGYAQALGLSPGIVAAFISRAVTEASKIAAAAGGEARTLLGLSGYGDLLACAGQADRPEVRLGYELAHHKPLADAMRHIGTRIEGVELIPRVIAFADDHKVACPIFRTLFEGVLAAKPTEDIVHTLMTAPLEDRA